MPTSSTLAAAAYTDPGLERAFLAALAGVDEDTWYRVAGDIPLAVFSTPESRDTFRTLSRARDTRDEAAARAVVTPTPLPDGFLTLKAVATRLVELAQRRVAAEQLAEVWQKLPAMPPAEVLAAAIEALSAAQNRLRQVFSTHIRTLDELLTEAESSVAEKSRLMAETGRPTAHPSFGPDLSSFTGLLGGMLPAVWAVGGEPGVGNYAKLFVM